LEETDEIGIIKDVKGSSKLILKTETEEKELALSTDVDQEWLFYHLGDKVKCHIIDGQVKEIRLAE